MYTATAYLCVIITIILQVCILVNDSLYCNKLANFYIKVHSQDHTAAVHYCMTIFIIYNPRF